MFVTKKHLTRRTALKGLGVALGLPLLDAMIPAGTALAQTAAKTTPHVGFIYFPHGAVMNRWTPTSEGQIGEFGDILKPLDKYKPMTTVFSNIDNQAAVGPVHEGSLEGHDGRRRNQVHACAGGRCRTRWWRRHGDDGEAGEAVKHGDRAAHRRAPGYSWTSKATISSV